MTNLDGVPSWSDPQILASNGLVHDELLELTATASVKRLVMP